jgi:tetratricopeptide (TPR) repeat protein
MEIAQHFFPPRTPDVLDEVANAVGAGLGAGIFGAIRVFSPQAASAAGVAVLAAALSGGLACGPPPREGRPGRPIESFLIEQGALRKKHTDADLCALYAELEKRAEPDEKPLFRYLRARLEDRESRRASLEVLASRTPPFEEAAIALGDLFFEDGDRRSALAWWSCADPRSPRALARAAYVLGDLDAARRALEAYDRTPEPRLPDGFVAAACFAIGDRERGERLLDEARALGVEDAATALVRGLACLEAGDGEAASRAFERAIALGRPPIVPPDAYVRATVEAVGALIRERRANEAEDLALLAASRVPVASELHHAAALAALARGDEPAALDRALRATALEAPSGVAARLARLLLVRAGRPEEAYRVWAESLPARALFGRENELLPRLEALRDVARAAGGRRDDRALWHGLARAFVACGWFEEAQAALDRLGLEDREVEMRVDLARRVRDALDALPQGARPAAAVEAVRAAAREAGLSRERAAIELEGGEAGTLATPAAPLVRELLESGLVLDIGDGGDHRRARLLAAVYLRHRGRALEIWAEGATAGLAGPMPRPPQAPPGLLGRATPLGTGFFVDLDAVRPSAAEALELAAARPEEAFSVETGAAAPGAIEGSAALRAVLAWRAAATLGPRAVVDARSAFLALFEARARYVAEHEAGHLADLAGLVPPLAHPFANLGRVIGAGFSPEAIAARYEEIAELFALARAPVPWVALLSLERALGRPGGGRRPAAADLGAAGARAAAVEIFRAIRDEGRSVLGDPEAPLERAMAAIDAPRLRDLARRRLADRGIALERFPP